MNSNNKKKNIDSSKGKSKMKQRYKKWIIMMMAIVIFLSSSGLEAKTIYAANNNSANNEEIKIANILPPSITLMPEPQLLDENRTIEPIQLDTAFEDVYGLDDSTSQSMQNRSFAAASLIQLEEEKQTQAIPFVSDSALADDQVEQLIANGATRWDIYQIHLLAAKEAIDPLATWSIWKESNLSWEQWLAEQHSLPEPASNVTDDVYMNEIARNEYGKDKQNELDLHNASDNTYMLAPELSLRSMAITNTNSLNNQVENAFRGMVMLPHINQTVKEQYSDRNQTEEIIDPATGSLTWKKNFLHYPGRDGLDLDISMMYQSNQAYSFLKANGEFPVLHYDGNGGEPILVNYPDAGNILWRTDNYNLNRYNIGLGWSFQFPSVQIDSGYSYYHDGQGAVYKIDFKATKGTEAVTHLVDYPGRTVKFMQDNGSFSNGQVSSSYYLEYGDKKREYFAVDGRLIGIVDRFGNQIKFEHKLQGTADGNAMLISQITDSVGRKITFLYVGSGKDDSLGMLQIISSSNAKDGRLELKLLTESSQVQFKEKALGFAPKLKQISYSRFDKDFELEYGDQINLNYTSTTARFNYDEKNYHPKMGLNVYNLLTEIEYPRSRTIYNYSGREIRNLGYYGMTDDFMITSRADEHKKKDESKNNNLINQVAYSYNGNYTGYPGVRNQEQLAESYRYSSTATIQSATEANNKTTKTTYSGKGQRLSVETQTANGEKRTDSILAYHSEFKNVPLKIASTIQDHGGSSTLYTEKKYDFLGNLIDETMPLTEGQLNDSNFRRTHSTTYAYEPNFNLLASKTSYQNENQPLTERYEYNQLGRIQSFTDANDQKTNYSYVMVPGQDKVVNKLTTEKPIGNGTVQREITYFEAATNYTFPQKVETYFRSASQGNQNHTEKSFIYDLRTGQVTEEKITDGNNTANSLTTKYQYDQWDRVISVQYPPVTNTDGEIYTSEDKYTYNDVFFDKEDRSPIQAAMLIRKDSVHIQSSTGKQTLMMPTAELYDGFGILSGQYALKNAPIIKGIPESVRIIDMNMYNYDDQLQLLQQVRKWNWSNENAAQQEMMFDPLTEQRYEYDSWGQIQKAIDVDHNQTVVDAVPSQYKENISFVNASGQTLNVMDHHYDQWGNLLSTTAYKNVAAKTDALTEQYSYDIAGNFITYLDPNGNKNDSGVTQRLEYDRLNRLIKLKDALNQTNNYRYDGNDQLIHVSLGNNSGVTQTIYNKEYNERSLALSKADAANQSSVYQYDGIGRMIGLTDRNGSKTSFKYDQRNTMIDYQKTMNSPKQQTVHYQYTVGKGDFLTSESSLGFDNKVPARQTIVTNPTQQIIRKNDTTTSGEYFAVTNFAYDFKGLIGNRYLFYGAGEDGFSRGATQYYSYDNQERLSSIQLPDSTKKIQYSYTPQGLVSSISYGILNKGQALVSNYRYDSLNRMIEMTNRLGDTELSASVYEYDANGNIIVTTERRKGTSPITLRYGYDKLNRLTEVRWNQELLSQYTYDLRGNRLTLEENRDFKNDLVESEYSYNALDQLESYKQKNSTSEFRYLPDGTRFEKQTQISDDTGKKTINTHRYINNEDGKVILEARTRDISEYVRGDRVLMKLNYGNELRSYFGNIHYYIYNGHGDVIGLLNSNGDMVNSYAYDEFGRTTMQQEKTYNPFKYAGEYEDAESGLYYLNARYYDPGMGRFINEDTYEGDIYDPLTLNVFTYVINNPLIYTDPTGNYHRADGGAVSGGGRASVPRWMTWGATGKPTVKSNTSLSAAKRVTVSPNTKAKISNSSFSKQVTQQLKDAMTVRNGTLAFKNFDLANAYVKPKHLSNSGNGGKFIENTKSGAEETLRSAMRRGVIDQVKDNGMTSQGKQSYEIIIDAGKVVGTRGQERIKIVISEDGGMLSAYPVK